MAITTRILVPLDDSDGAEEAIPYAQALLPDGGELVALRVTADVAQPLTALPGVPDVTLDGAAAPELAAARADLDRVRARLADPRLHWTIETARGDPAAAIVRVAAARRVGLIAMTTHGRGAIGRLLFGSVADRVVRHAPMPVLLVRPVADAQATIGQIQRVVVPLDGSALAEAAVPLATELAERLTAPIVLLQAVDAEMAHSPLGDLGIPDLGEQIARARLERARTDLETVANRLRGPGREANVQVLDGSPFFVIAEALRPDDLLVLTSHGRGGVQRWLIGSVAEKLVRTAPCPVLLVPSPERRRGHAASERF